MTQGTSKPKKTTNKSKVPQTSPVKTQNLPHQRGRLNGLTSSGPRHVTSDPAPIVLQQKENFDPMTGPEYLDDKKCLRFCQGRVKIINI